MLSSIISFLHFVTAFGIAGSLIAEWATFSASPTFREARLIQQYDRWYGISAGVVLVAGFLRVFYFEKGSAFYFGNPFFHAKVGLFLAIGLLSIYPTIRFIKWRAGMADGKAPVVAAGEYRTIRALLRLELVLLVALVLCATFMARGIGL